VLFTSRLFQLIGITVFILEKTILFANALVSRAYRFVKSTKFLAPRPVTMAFIYYIFRQVSKTTRLTAAGNSPGADFFRFFTEGG
jgi:hypothetical protein